MTRTFQVPQELLGKDELTDQELSITIDVNKGMVEDVMLMVPHGLKAAKGFSGQAEVVTSLKGQRFSEEAITMLQRALSELESPDHTRNEFVVDCMRQVVTSVWHAQFAPFEWDCWWISRNYSFMYVPYLCIKEYIHLCSKPTAALLWPWLGRFTGIQIIYNDCPNCISKISSDFTYAVWVIDTRHICIVAEISQWTSLYDRTCFISVHLLVCYISVKKNYSFFFS